LNDSDSEADRLIRHRTGTDLLTFLDRLEVLPREVSQTFTQAIMDTWKFAQHTEQDLLEAAAGDPDVFLAIEAHLRRNPADHFPVLNRSAYDFPSSTAGVLRAAHETALAGLVNLIDAAQAVLDHGR
jgi:hypothetical protein